MCDGPSVCEVGYSETTGVVAGQAFCLLTMIRKYMVVFISVLCMIPYEFSDNPSADECGMCAHVTTSHESLTLKSHDNLITEL